jgi:putative membrane protein
VLSSLIIGQNCLKGKACEFCGVLWRAFEHGGYNQSVRYWLIHWLLSGVALLIVSRIIPGIEVDGLGAALIAALVIGLVGATVGLILKIVLLPFIILTLGIVYFLINGLMLKLASEFVPGFRVNGCLPAVVGSILLTIVDYILTRFAGF